MATYTMITRSVLRSLKFRGKLLASPLPNGPFQSGLRLSNARNISGSNWYDVIVVGPSRSWRSLCTGLGLASGMLLSCYAVNRGVRRPTLCSAAAHSRGTNETSERSLSDTDAGRLKLTLYQYQVCPFCCKLRAFLDFYGVPYQIVEVDPIRRKEVKFSEYRKVPILVQEGPGSLTTQLNDSSVIISALTTYMSTEEKDLQTIISYFPKIETQDSKGKKTFEFVNRYEIMTGKPGQTAAEKEEKQWREWVDAVLVHYIPPNIYRNPSESLQAFSYITSQSKYNAFQQFVIKYAGAVGMFFVAKKLKKKYDIPDDVRACLYTAAQDWTDAVGSRNFMGGNKPNLADLAVFGVLSSIEGLDAFNDMLFNTGIGAWYKRTKRAVSKRDSTT